MPHLNKTKLGQLVWGWDLHFLMMLMLKSEHDNNYVII